QGPDGNLVDAAKAGILPAVIAFLAKGADVNAVGASGETALMWAVARGHAEIFDIIMTAGGDPDQADKSGLSPRQLAVNKDRTGFLDRFDIKLKD
ncbi:MAG TPA: ankyrin repeat domain-containing protein, partial [Rhodospirillales bacterium]|nr:ankyrin repeat domain-containing protein [Rhodospirillales bacterium]